MPWSRVTAATDYDSTSVAKAVTAGNLVIVGIADQTSGDTLAISDGVNTWARIGAQLQDTVSNMDFSMTWWWCVAATTATITATITGLGGGHHSPWIAEWSHSGGAIAADALVASSGNKAAADNGGSVATDGDTSGAAIPGFDGSLIVGYIIECQDGTGDGTSKFAPGTSFTEWAAASLDSLAFTMVHAVEDREQATSASAAATFTCVNTNSYAALAAFFKPPGGAAGQPAAARIATDTPGLAVGSVRRM